MKNKIKAVLFDLDDTLWPINPVIAKAEIVLHGWLGAHAPKVARQFTIAELRARRMRLMEADPRYKVELRAVRQASLTEAFIATGEDVAKVGAAMAVFDKERNAVTLYDDVVPGLLRLGTRFATGSISNGFSNLEEIGIAHHFDVSIAAHRFGFAKPDREIFHAACDMLKVKPSEAVYVGDDTAADVEGAQKAGLRGLLMNRPDLQPIKRLPSHIKPDVILTDLHELVRWLGI